MSVNTESDCR
jgi:hypothetical protein